MPTKFLTEKVIKISKKKSPMPRNGRYDNSWIIHAYKKKDTRNLAKYLEV